MEKNFVGMECCMYCGEAKYVLMDMKLRDSIPKKVCTNIEPCDDCKEKYKDFVIFVEGRQVPNLRRKKGEPEVTIEPLDRYATVHHDDFRANFCDGDMTAECPNIAWADTELMNKIILSLERAGAERE